MTEDRIVPFSKGGIVPATVMEPDADLIAKIEEWLEKAKSGQLRAMAYVMITRDRAIGTGWTGHSDQHDMTAGVNTLAWRFMREAQDFNDQES